MARRGMKRRRASIQQVLRSVAAYDAVHGEEWRAKLLRGAADRIDTLQKMDSEAATYVEGTICMRSRHFTGDPPYVGWKGLGLALNQDYDELARLRELCALRVVDKP